MKAIQRALNDPYKVMRTIIKYKSEKIKDWNFLGPVIEQNLMQKIA